MTPEKDSKEFDYMSIDVVKKEQLSLLEKKIVQLVTYTKNIKEKNVVLEKENDSLKKQLLANSNVSQKHKESFEKEKLEIKNLIDSLIHDIDELVEH